MESKVEPRVITEPLQSAKCVTPKHLALLRFPLIVSPKEDGIRGVVHPVKALVSRTFKPIPNKHIREKVRLMQLQGLGVGLDSEVVTFHEDGSQKKYNDIQSDVMSQGGQPKFALKVFDHINMPDDPFNVRLNMARITVDTLVSQYDAPLVMVPHYRVNDLFALMELYHKFLDQGYEGIMMRDPLGIYKCGRSTLLQNILVKMKPEEEAEGVVVGFEEQMRNENPAGEDEFGRTKRSSKKEGMVPAGTLGKLIVLTEKWGRLPIGGGVMDHAERQHVWDNRPDYISKIATFKYQVEGMAEKPRFPIFKGWRKD